MSEQDDHIKQAANDLYDDLLIGADCLIGDSDALEFDDALSARIEACMRLRIRQAVDRVVPQPSLTPADLIALRDKWTQTAALADSLATQGGITTRERGELIGEARLARRCAKDLDALITRLSSETEKENKP